MSTTLNEKEERKPFMQTSQNKNSLKKREEFATSLRKSKRNTIIQEKRRKIQVVRDKQEIKGEHKLAKSFAEDKDRWTSASYNGYDLFLERKEFFKTLVMKIAPDIDSYGSIKLTQMQYLCTILLNDTDDLLSIQQLGLLTCIRDVLSSQD